MCYNITPSSFFWPPTAMCGGEAVLGKQRQDDKHNLRLWRDMVKRRTALLSAVFCFTKLVSVTIVSTKK
jgi:hypothetical protein